MRTPEDQSDLLRLLRLLRWPLAGTVGLVFALGRLAEGLVLANVLELSAQPLARALDSLFWGVLAFGAVWMVLSWAARQERRYRSAEARMLAALRESNANLELLNEINQRLVTRTTLDEIFDYAISLPGRLMGARAAALVVRDENGAPLTIRSVGMSAELLGTARTAFDLSGQLDTTNGPRIFTPGSKANLPFNVCVVLPLVEIGPNSEATGARLGWIEAYLNTNQRDARHTLFQPALTTGLGTESWSDDEDQDEPQLTGAANGHGGALLLNEKTTRLLITVAGELTEAMVGARRRAREIASVAALEQAITEERTRIAHDLHDGIAQSLAFMRMRVDLWEDWLRDDPQRLRKEFTDFKANLRTQIEELRRAIFALRPVELSQLGFEGALRRFVVDFAAQQGWRLDLEFSDLPHELPHLLELASFRVVQEALNNSAKHSRASEVHVALRLTDGGLQLVIRDDGVGFDPGALGERGDVHLGLRQMRERIAALDGHLTLISRPGAGTELRVWLPIMYAAAQPV